MILFLLSLLYKITTHFEEFLHNKTFLQAKLCLLNLLLLLEISQMLDVIKLSRLLINKKNSNGTCPEEHQITLLTNQIVYHVQTLFVVNVLETNNPVMGHAMPAIILVFHCVL